MSVDWAVSIHDVAPATWPACERLLALVRAYGIPVSLLVTPEFRRGVRSDAVPAFALALRERVAQGDEVLLHGYYHVDDGPRPRTLRGRLERRLLTAAEGEFAALPADEARRRIADGTRMLERMDLRPAGFVPPAWLLGPGARTALADAAGAAVGGPAGGALRYTSTRDELLVLPTFAVVRAPSLVYSTRAAWRRVASRGWNRRRLAALADEPRIRVALHPAEAAFPRVLDEWRTLCDALAARRRPVLETAWLPASVTRPQLLRASSAAAP